MRPLCRREALFLKMPHHVYGMVWGVECKRSPDYILLHFFTGAISWFLRFLGGERGGSERLSGCFVILCKPYILISVVMASIRNRVEKAENLASCGHGDDGKNGALWCERSHPSSANKQNSLINISQALAVSLGHRKALTQGSGFSRKFSPRWFLV